MKKERVRTKRGFKGFGHFILGWFVGFVSTLGILFGVGYWAYTSVTVKRIEKWTKTEITNKEGLEDLTLKKALGIAQGIASNDANAYTLAKLEEDFGVKLLGDSFYGISTDIIKNSPIKNLKQAVNDTIDTATFNNILSFMNVEQDTLGLLNTVLESEVTYYVGNGKLCTTEECDIEVGFDYTIKYDTNNIPERVEFANGTHTITTKNGVQSIKPRLSDLPLNTALTSMTDATKDLKIYEVLGYERSGEEGNYTYTDAGNPVTGIMDSLAEYTVGELSNSETFNNIYIYEVMGYEDLGNGEYSYINDSDQEVRVSGAMKAIAGKTIGEMSNPSTLNNLKIYEVLDYYYNQNDGKYYENYDGTNYSNQVTGAMKTLAGKSINDLSNPNTVNNFYVYEVMGYDRAGEEGSYTYTDNGVAVEGIMETLAGKKISELDDAGAFNDVTVADAMGYYYNDNDENYYQNYDGTTYSNKVEGIFAHLADAKVSQLSTRINTLTIGQVLDIEESEATGVLKSLYGTSVEDLDTKLDTLTLGEALGIELSDASGVLKALHGVEIDQLDTEIKALTLGKALDIAEGDAKGIVKALHGVKITELQGEIDNLTLGKALGIEQSSATGVIKALYNSKVNELDKDVSDLQIYQIMGYTREGTEGNYIYKNGETKVTGIMNAIAGTKVNDLGSNIETLKAKDVFDVENTTILNLFTTAELETITIMDLPNQVISKMNSATTTIEYLVTKGIITGVDQDSAYYNSIKTLTLSQLINGLAV
ncbi:MAG: hypothetical protein IJ458_01800 [Clostridia bacterium]|nr:hypothetical protein [Clostridia bacterium]